jgi:hypothetical protein
MDERKAALAGAIKAASFAIDRVLRDQLVGLPVSAASDLRGENVALRRLLWLSHLGEMAILAGETAPAKCGGCGADFDRDPVEALARALWRCPGGPRR